MHFNGILPPEVLSKTSRLILTDTQQLLIEGHKGLISYDTDCIKAQLTKALLICCGQHLTISQFGADDMLIQGQILSLEFKR